MAVNDLEKEWGKCKITVGEFEHCGFIYKQIENGDIEMHQNHYIDRVEPLDFPEHVDLEKVCRDQDAAACVTVLGRRGRLVKFRLDLAIFCGSLQRWYVGMKKLITIVKYAKKYEIVHTWDF